MVERNEINQTNETNQINQLGPPQPFSYTPVVGQTTQNPELITHNFPKRAGDFSWGKGYSVAATPDSER